MLAKAYLLFQIDHNQNFDCTCRLIPLFTVTRFVVLESELDVGWPNRSCECREAPRSQYISWSETKSSFLEIGVENAAWKGGHKLSRTRIKRLGTYTPIHALPSTSKLRVAADLALVGCRVHLLLLQLPQ